MRILVITPMCYNSVRSGGAEVYIFELIKQVGERTNIEIEVLTSCENKEQLVFSGSRVHIKYLSTSIFTFPFLLFFHIWRYVKSADLVIENISKFPLITPVLISKVLKKPFIAIVHHIHGRTLFVELPLVIALSLLVYEYVSLFIYALLKVPIITVSKTSKAELWRLGFRDIHVVSPALRYSVDNNNNILCKSKKPLVIYVGRIKKYKRIDHLIRACQYIIKEVPGTVCLIVGKGDRSVENKSRRIASALGVSERVKIYVGCINEDLKLKLLRRAWLYVFTSMKEGFGMSVVEALSQNVPVVAYDIPAVKEVVGKCSSGVLVENGNINKLAVQCVNLLNNKETLWAMSSRARRCVEIYNYDNLLKNFIRVIKALLKHMR